MTSADISLLRDILKTGRTMVWMPDHAPIRRVLSLPGDYAVLDAGGTIDLRECNPNHFFTAVPFFCLPSFTPSQAQLDDFNRARGSTY